MVDNRHEYLEWQGLNDHRLWELINHHSTIEVLWQLSLIYTNHHETLDVWIFLVGIKMEIRSNDLNKNEKNKDNEGCNKNKYRNKNYD